MQRHLNWVERGGGALFCKVKHSRTKNLFVLLVKISDKTTPPPIPLYLKFASDVTEQYWSQFKLMRFTGNFK